MSSGTPQVDSPNSVAPAFWEALGERRVSTIESAQRVVENLTGRPIRVREVEALRHERVCGLVFRLPSKDLILVSPTPSREFREFVVGHELGHLVMAHSGKMEDTAFVKDLMPDLPDALLQRALARDTVNEEYEREAELFADALTQSMFEARRARSPFRSVFGS